MSNAEQRLLPGETVVWRTRVHWFVLVGPIIFTSFFALAGLVFCFAMATPGGSAPGSLILGAIGLTLLVSALTEAAIAYAGWKASEVLLTDRRIVGSAGVFRTTALDIRLDAIEGVIVQQWRVGRAFDFGNLVIHLHGGAAKHLRRIRHPEPFERCLLRACGVTMLIMARPERKSRHA